VNRTWCFSVDLNVRKYSIAVMASKVAQEDNDPDGSSGRFSRHAIADQTHPHLLDHSTGKNTSEC